MPSGKKPTIVEGVQSKKHYLYNTWVQMRQRCFNEGCVPYPYYGGRGITVCDRWASSFSSFVEDMGPRPEGASLDRIDNDGDYTPENCKWSTKEEQMQNRGGRKDNTIGVPNVNKRNDSGGYRLNLKRGGLFLNKTFRTLEAAIEARDNFLKEIEQNA